MTFFALQARSELTRARQQVQTCFDEARARGVAQEERLRLLNAELTEACANAQAWEEACRQAQEELRRAEGRAQEMQLNMAVKDTESEHLGKVRP